jgi:hypothetical protein
MVMPWESNDRFIDRAVFTYRWCWRPRRCYKTRQWLFCTIALHGRTDNTDTNRRYVKERWYHRHEGLMLMLKKESNGIV